LQPPLLFRIAAKFHALLTQLVTIARTKREVFCNIQHALQNSTQNNETKN